jgi:hypothetical protein
MQSILFSAGVVASSIAWTILWRVLFEMSDSLALVASPVRLLISLGIFAYWLFTELTVKTASCQQNFLTHANSLASGTSSESH